ncbi:MAG: zinc metallopeptidase [Gemmatimonadetes bacterium]|nr:zinc metallopeptidase [Gemmatimonadota bacterium]
MRWTRKGRSRNLEDRRFQTSRRRGAGVGLGGMLLLLILSFFLGPEVMQILGPALSAPAPPATDRSAPAGRASPEEEELVDFMSFILDDIQATWAQVLPSASGTAYQETQLVLFRDATPTACGYGQSATGPFYCPGDRKMYLDLSFFDQLNRRFGAPGDFAQAYVIAHEIGHHIQTITGIEQQVRAAQARSPESRNQIQVRMELQADCLAGVWGNSTARRDLLQRGDIEEGLRAAASIGDDAIQEQTTGRVRPESFTHGSSEQRVEWLRRGLETGDVGACDTFAGGI